MLGNIKFIGELYRLDLIQESIMHKCIKQLINKKKKGTLADMAEDLECLCQIMTTCGRRLDHEKAKSLMDQYFKRVEALRRKNADLPSRIRFMLQDVLDLRKNNWFPRRVNRDTGPKTLSQIRRDVEEIYPSVNGGGFEECGSRGAISKFSSSPSFGSGFRSSNYQGNGSHFPQSPQYSGSFRGSSPPPVHHAIPDDKSGSFDFFGPVNPQLIRPMAPVEKPSPSNNMSAPPPPLGHASSNAPMRFSDPRHAPQPYLAYNGYSHGPMMNNPRPAMGPYTSEPRVPTSGPKIQQRDTGSRHGNPASQKVDHKPGKEIPPRFQRQKQQKRMEMQSKELEMTPPPAATSKSSGSMVPRKAPVFTALNSNQEQPAVRQTEVTPYTPPTVPFKKGTPLGTTNTGIKLPTNGPGISPRSYSATAKASIPLRTNRHPSPTIGENNVDAIQPPFQQVLDNASKQVVFAKKPNPISVEKSKPKKSASSKADVEKISDEILEKFFSKVKNSEQVGKSLSEMKVQRKHLPVFVNRTFLKVLEKSDEEKEKICRLLANLVSMKMLSKDHVLEGLQTVLEKLGDLEEEIPLIKSALASLIGRLVVCDLLTLGSIGDSLVGGYHFPLFLLTLKQIGKVRDEAWITKLFKESKIEMMKMLPEASQNKPTMVGILEGKQLQFLFPLAHIESKLTNQIQQNPNPASIYKWIKENVTSDLHSDPGFINVLVSCCLDHVTKMSSLSQGSDTQANPAKEVKEKERHLLTEIKPVLQKLLNENQRLQLHALYSAQVFCHEKQFPKGLLLRLFNGMYEEDIIDEETYFIWKEDVGNDQYPGKGQALFQVNAWLTWLHEAETEDEDGE